MPLDRPDHVCRRKHTRKRRTSDSSVLAPASLQHNTTTNKRKPLTHSGADSSTYSQASHATCSEASTGSTSTQKYTRRPRRKTRPERYDPSAKVVHERGHHAHRSQKRESKKVRRKSKRDRVQKPASVVQCFHAKNVARDRLTVRAAMNVVMWSCTDDWLS